MKVLFAVNNEKDAESITRVYQEEYKEIISSKTVYYFNAIIKELQKDKTYDRIVISEDLEMFANDNYEAIDRFIFDKMDAISDEATNAEGNDIPIILLCLDRRTKNDTLLVKLFGLGLYNVLVGQDRSIQKVCDLMYKPRSKKEAKLYYKVEPESVNYTVENKNNGVSESEIQNILKHYKKIGNNVSKCVQSFESIVSQYSKEQIKLIIQVLPVNVKVILEENSDLYRKIMGIKGRKVTGISNLRQKEYVEKEIDVGSKLTKPVIIPTTVSTKKVTKVKSEEELTKEKAQAEARRKEQERIAKEKAEARRKERERIAKEKAEAEARRKEEERIAKEKAEAKKKEQERIAKEKAEAEARRKEEERIAKEKAEAEVRRKEQERIAKEKAEARRKEEERIAKEKAEAEARRKEEERIAKEKAEAEARRKEEERIAKEKAEAEARRKEEERIAKEKAEAEARRKEEERIAKEKAEAEARRKEEERIAKEKAEAEARRKEEERIAKEKAEAKKKEQEKQEKEKADKNMEEKNNVQPVKRGRGRPRKTQVIEDEVPVKKKRGRPRKNIIIEEDIIEDVQKNNGEKVDIKDKNNNYEDEENLVNINNYVEEDNELINNDLLEDEEILLGFEDYNEDNELDVLDEQEDIDYNLLDEEDNEDIDYNLLEDEEEEDIDYDLLDEEDEDIDYDLLDEEEEDIDYNLLEEEEDIDYDLLDEEDEDVDYDLLDEEDEDIDYDLLDEEEEDIDYDLLDEEEEGIDYDLLDEEEDIDYDLLDEGEDIDYDLLDEGEDTEFDSVDDDEEDKDYDLLDNNESRDETLPGFEDYEDSEDLLDFDDEEEFSILPGFDSDDETQAVLENIDESNEDEEKDEDTIDDEEDNVKEIQHNGSFKGINNRNYRYDNNLANSIKDLQEIEENTSYNIDTDNLITSDKKIISFVGTSKNGTSFIVNNLADIFSNKGIKTAILDLTKNKNSYYIYTNNEDELREKTHKCLENLKEGIDDGVVINKNLTVFTSLPGDDDCLDDVTNIIKTLLQNYSIVLLDCDFGTDVRYFKVAQEIYLVQSLDVLTIQPLTAFLRDLKVKGILEINKLRIIINKNLRVNSITDKILIGGMSVYNDPGMTYMTELFDKDTIKYTTLPFEEQVYVRYLDGLVNCRISSKGYSKNFISSLNKLSDMVYPTINGKKAKKIYNDYSKVNKKYEDTFSKNTSSTLDKMKKKF